MKYLLLLVVLFVVLMFLIKQKSNDEGQIETDIFRIFL